MVVPRKYDKKSDDSSKVVTRSDIEKKLNEIDDVIEEATSTSKDIAKLALGVCVVVVVGLAFYSGRRRALRSKTIISFVKSK